MSYLSPSLTDRGSLEEDTMIDLLVAVLHKVPCNRMGFDRMDNKLESTRMSSPII